MRRRSVSSEKQITAFFWACPGEVCVLRGTFTQAPSLVQMDKVFAVEQLQVGESKLPVAEVLAGKKYCLLYFSGA